MFHYTLHLEAKTIPVGCLAPPVCTQSGGFLVLFRVDVDRERGRIPDRLESFEIRVRRVRPHRVGFVRGSWLGPDTLCRSTSHGRAGSRIISPLPSTVLKPIDSMAVYPLLEGWNVDVSLAFLAILELARRIGSVTVSTLDSTRRTSSTRSVVVV